MSMHTLRPRRVPAVPKGSPPSGIGPKAKQKPSLLLGREPPTACGRESGGAGECEVAGAGMVVGRVY